MDLVSASMGHNYIHTYIQHAHKHTHTHVHIHMCSNIHSHTHTPHTPGKWISSARAWGTTTQEADMFEFNARNVIVSTYIHTYIHTHGTQLHKSLICLSSMQEKCDCEYIHTYIHTYTWDTTTQESYMFEFNAREM